MIKNSVPLILNMLITLAHLANKLHVMAGCKETTTQTRVIALERDTLAIMLKLISVHIYMHQALFSLCETSNMEKFQYTTT